MSLFDTISNTVHKVLPEKKHKIPLHSSGSGIGNGHAPFEDDMIVSKTAIVFFASQILFNFLAMCCFCGAAAFQAHWKVGPSGLSGFAIFISIFGIFFSFFLLLTPVIYEKYDKGARLARALKEDRVNFILTSTGVVISLLIAFITTISAFGEAGCKNPDNDPHAKLGDDFKNGLSGFCANKKAAAIFFWLVFVFWIATLVLTVMDWRSGKTRGPRDAPFNPPQEPSDLVSQEDEESLYQPPARKPTYDEHDQDHEGDPSPFSDEHQYGGVPSVSNNSYNYDPSQPPVLPRPSIDAYGAFSDPAPSGFDNAPRDYSARPLTPPYEAEDSHISRTMQYADPYAAVRATVASSPSPAPTYGRF